MGKSARENQSSPTKIFVTFSTSIITYRHRSFKTFDKLFFHVIYIFNKMFK